MRVSFDEIYIDLAIAIAKRSHCVRRQVGAVISKDNRVVSLGYNGPPANTYNCDEEWPNIGCPLSIAGGCSLAVHAEENAILYATKQNISLNRAVIYTTLSPCLSCAKLIYTVGIERLVYLELYSSYKNIAREEGIEFLNQFKVKIEHFSKS